MTKNNKTVDIYLITNMLNFKQYVGQSCVGYERRFRQHCRDSQSNKTSTQYIDRAIHKYGKENFKLELIDVVPIEDWKKWERYYIKLYKTHYTQGGYNLTWGGDDNPMFNKHSRLKHKQICESLEHRKKQKLNSLKRYEDPQVRKQISETSKKVWSNYTSEQRDATLKGFYEYNKSKRIKVATVDENDNIIKIFESASQACIYYGRKSKEAGNLLNNCNKINKNGKRAKHFGQYWVTL